MTEEALKKINEQNALVRRQENDLMEIEKFYEKFTKFADADEMVICCNVLKHHDYQPEPERLLATVRISTTKFEQFLRSEVLRHQHRLDFTMKEFKEM